MPLDMSAVYKSKISAEDFAKDYSKDDLLTLTNESIDYMLDLISDLSDEQIIFDPVDEGASDPDAVEGEEGIGWSIAHIIAHVTASSEEGAAFSSVLSRGHAQEERPRYETPWRDITTKAQCIQRLEESRRMRHAFLLTWPTDPHLDVYRIVSERFTAKFGKMNAPAAFLFGPAHEFGHHAQMAEVKKQAVKK